MGRFRWWSSVARMALVLSAVMGCSRAPAPGGAEPFDDPRVPDQIGDLRVVEEQVFDTETIYTYIDGHAEVYMAYGMQRCISRRFEGTDGEPTVVLDLFELASPADAFGVFTHDRDGEEIEVGQGALLRSGWLSFWKGRWYGSVYAETESDRAQNALTAIAQQAAAAIEKEGELPPLVAELPARGLDERSIRFLRTQEILNMVVYLGFDNVFGFGPRVGAVVGHYSLDEGEAWLLLVDYPDEAAAGRAEGAAGEAGLVVSRSNDRLAAVLAPKPAAAADAVIALVGGGPE